MMYCQFLDTCMAPGLDLKMFLGNFVTYWKQMPFYPLNQYITIVLSKVRAAQKYFSPMQTALAPLLSRLTKNFSGVEFLLSFFQALRLKRVIQFLVVAISSLEPLKSRAVIECIEFEAFSLNEPKQKPSYSCSSSQFFFSLNTSFGGSCFLTAQGLGSSSLIVDLTFAYVSTVLPSTGLFCFRRHAQSEAARPKPTGITRYYNYMSEALGSITNYIQNNLFLFRCRQQNCFITITMISKPKSKQIKNYQ